MSFLLIDADTWTSAHWISAPWVRVAYGTTVGVAALWLAADTFARWRRRAANLTPVATATATSSQPGFLQPDHEAREAALERADAYEQHLREREAAERQAAAERAAESAVGVKRLTGAMTLFMSLFTLASMIAGTVWQVTWIGTVAERYTAIEKLEAVIRAHPLAFTVAVLVIGYHVFDFIAERRWRRNA